ncbi:unnamed protein product [Litomosoides sigmodontis]|uniref:Uncharacterized protein n=1 Tax=Litomosoides sigmodontis TaxID=42156 RepID=A0A3P6UVG8_LITSI|nr:unnamed protein product [Litomosoides sigmodontis]
MLDRNLGFLAHTPPQNTPVYFPLPTRPHNILHVLLCQVRSHISSLLSNIGHYVQHQVMHESIAYGHIDHI